MERFAGDLRKIKENLRGCRDDEIRGRARVLIRVMESNGSVRMACDLMGVVPKTFYSWLKRLRIAEYDIAALKSKPRRPHNSPNQIPEETVKLLMHIRQTTGNCGGVIVSYIYNDKTGKAISHSACDKVFARMGVTCKRRIKPNLHKKRYASKNPLDRVQFDTLWLGIEDDHANRVYTVNGVDCCSRFAFLRTFDSHDSAAAESTLEAFLREVGRPAVVQTDNGVEFTARYTSELSAKRKKEAVLAPFEAILAERKIHHHLIRPRTPQLNGKVERFNRTLLRWVAAANLDGQPLHEIERAIQSFVTWYNYRRPHSALNGLAPAAAFPKLPPLRAA